MNTPFKRVGLLGRFGDPKVAEPAQSIVEHLENRGIETWLAAAPDMPAQLAKLRCIGTDELGAHVDLAIAVGGDGTMLYAARHLASQKVPLLGINRGRLGFLTDVSPELVEDSIDAVLAGDYVNEQRVMLRAEIETATGIEGPMIALNDVVVQKRDTGHMLDFVTWVDGSYVNSHGGDGLIVSTATGSTAYALSCGGPIIHPAVDALVMVPICPHTLSDRPLVLNASSTVEVRVDQRLDTQAQAVCDGELLGELGPDDLLRINMAKDRIELIHPQGHNYFEILRSKLSWGRPNRLGVKRNR